MRILIPLIATLSLSIGCSKDRTDADPCARAVANAQRLVKQDTAAQQRYGTHPLTLESCREASPNEIACIGYASDWRELEGCSSTALDEVSTR